MEVDEVRSIHAKFILNQLDAVCNSNLRLDFWPRDGKYPSTGLRHRRRSQDDVDRRIVSGAIFSPGALSISSPRLCHRARLYRAWLAPLRRWPRPRTVRASLPRQEPFPRARTFPLA